MIHSPWEGLMMKECSHSTKTLMRRKGRAWYEYKEFLSKIRNIGVLENLFSNCFLNLFYFWCHTLPFPRESHLKKDKEKKL